jgi:hypothetical protein
VHGGFLKERVLWRIRLALDGGNDDRFVFIGVRIGNCLRAYHQDGAMT